MTLRLTLLSVLALTLPACGDDKNQTTGDPDTGGATTGDSATDSTVGMSSEPTTGDVPLTTSAGSDSQTSAMTTVDSVSGSTTVGPEETTTASDTTGEVDPKIAQLCADVCAQFVECEVMPDADACVAGCVDNFGAQDGLCLAASTDALTCFETMTCDELKAFFDDEDPGPCAEQVKAEADACPGQECTGSIGVNENGTECSVSTQCPDEPKLEMTCDAETCTCSVGDMQTGECPSEGVCQDLDQVEAKTEACCGF